MALASISMDEGYFNDATFSIQIFQYVFEGARNCAQSALSPNMTIIRTKQMMMSGMRLFNRGSVLVPEEHKPWTAPSIYSTGPTRSFPISEG